MTAGTLGAERQQRPRFFCPLGLPDFGEILLFLIDKFALTQRLKALFTILSFLSFQGLVSVLRAPASYLGARAAHR